MIERLTTAQWWVLRDAFNKDGIAVRKARRRAARVLISAGLLVSSNKAVERVWITDAGRGRVLEEADTILIGPWRNKIAEGRKA